MESVRELWGAGVLACMWLLSAALSGSTPAYAQTDGGFFFTYQQVYGAGFATDAEVERALGTLSFSMTECANGWPGPLRRSVAVSATGNDFSDHRVVETVLYRAVTYAYRACPLYFYSVGLTLTDKPQYNVSSVTLSLGDGTDAIDASGFMGDTAFSAGASYGWQSVTESATGAAARREAAAIRSAELQNEEAANRAAEAAVQAEAARERAAEEAQRAAAEAAREAARRHAALIRKIHRDALWALAALVLLILFLSRTFLARTYYYYLHPHPARRIVNRALTAGTVLDGKVLAAAFTRAFGELASANRFLRAARIEQMERMFQDMQAASVRYLKQTRARSQAAERMKFDETMFVSLQEAIELAAAVLERAKMQFEASKRGGRV